MFQSLPTTITQITNTLHLRFTTIGVVDTVQEGEATEAPAEPAATLKPPATKVKAPPSTDIVRKLTGSESPSVARRSVRHVNNKLYKLLNQQNHNPNIKDIVRCV